VGVSEVALKIENASALTDVFGRWPSFHDAEVVSISLDREGVAGPEIITAIHVFEITSEVTPEGFYGLQHHTRVTFNFEGVEEVELAGFNDQNALFDLIFEDISSRQLDWLKWDVRFDSSHGVGASFMCRAIRIDNVVPFEPRPATGSPYGRRSGPRPL
jgi:hypothetical protein